MITFVFAFALLLGIFLWYIYYSVECLINDGGIGTNQYTMAFYHASWDFLFCLPFGWGNYYRLKFSDGNQEWADMMPGRWHFLFTHIMIPLLPLTVIIIAKRGF